MTGCDALSRNINVSFELRRLNDAQISSDGNCVAFVVSHCARDSTAHPPAQIWRVTTAGGDEYPLTAGRGSDKLPRWSPVQSAEERTHLPADLAFVSDRDDTACGVHLPYILPASGGEPRRMGGIDGDVSDMTWLPCGDRLVLLVRDRPSPEEGDADGPVLFSEESPRQRLWLADLETDRARPLTPSSVHVWEYNISPTGHSIVALASEDPLTQSWYDAELVTTSIPGDADACSAPVQPLYRPPAGVQLACPVWSPEGDRVAVLACTCSDPGLVTGDVLLLDACGGGAPHNLTEGETMSVNWLHWSEAGSLLVSGYDAGALAVARLRVNSGAGSMERIWRCRCASSGRAVFTLDAAEQNLTMPTESPTEPPEIWLWNLSDNHTPRRRLTSINQSICRGRMGETEEVQWYAPDGLQVQGLLIRPVDHDVNRRYPLVVQVHGGPTALHSHRFYAAPDTPAQLLASRGFAVLLPNPRGSAGWGREFSDANIGRVGEDDFADIMAGIDHCVEMGVADPDRIGIGGSSYGGYLSAWAISQSDRFRAAVISAGIVNVLSFYGTSDRPNYAEQFHACDPYGDEVFMQYSPISYARCINVPTLITHGEKDRCCHVGQAMELHRALQGRVPVRLAIYPGEGHGLRKRDHMEDYLRRVVEWFEKYLTPRA